MPLVPTTFQVSRASISLFAIAFFAFAAPAFAEATPVQPVQQPVPAFDRTAIYLAAETIHPAPADSLHRTPDRIVRGARHLIQFNEPLTRAQRRTLADAGVHLSDYVPFNSYIAAIDSDADLTLLPSAGFIRW